MAVDPQLRAYYNALADRFAPLPDPYDVQARRQRFEEMARSLEAPVPEGIVVSELSLPLSGRALPAKIFRPATGGVLPLMVYFHGGGWVIGSSNTHASLCAWLARDTGCAVVSVDYRMAPEHAFPLPCEDALDAVLWLAEQRLRLGFATDWLAVGGDSAGAHLAAQAAQEANEHGRPGLVDAQLLIYPVVAPAFGTESYAAFADGPGLTRDEMQWYWRQFIGDAATAQGEANDDVRLHLMATPPLHPPPDSVVIVAAHDVLRDGGLAYADYLVQHGAQVATIEASGMTHGFARLQAESVRARQWMERAAAAFRGLMPGP